MQIRIFTISVNDTGEQIREMNGFLASQKVLEIVQQFYQNTNGAFWSFCIKYIASSSGVFSQNNGKQKIDYKEVLDEKEFQVFSKLRECRKTIATSEAIHLPEVFVISARKFRLLHVHTSHSQRRATTRHCKPSEAPVLAKSKQSTPYTSRRFSCLESLSVRKFPGH